MPIYFRFTNSATGRTMDLAEIDNELRERLNIPADPENYSPAFWVLTGIGDLSFDQNGDFVWIRFNRACEDQNISYTTQFIFEDFLNGKYVYSSWR